MPITLILNDNTKLIYHIEIPITATKLLFELPSKLNYKPTWANNLIWSLA